MINILWTRAGFGSRILIYVLLVAAAVFTLVPFLWAAINSVKTLTETFQLGAFIPFLQFQPTLGFLEGGAERPADRKRLHQQLRGQRRDDRLLADSRRSGGLCAGAL